MENADNTGRFDNLGHIIDSVLGNPDSAAKLRETARQLGLDIPGEDASPDHRVDSHEEELSAQPKNAAESLAGLAPALGKLAPLLSRLNEEDDMTRLLHALRPYLSGARLKRAEEADRIVSVMRVLPLLRQAGENR